LSSPNTEAELTCYLKGHRFVAGVDEVGRGCLAGPVVAAAVILPLDRIPAGIDDSKKLTPAQRTTIAGEIRRRAVAWAIGVGEVDEIDTVNIFVASKLAMARAVDQLKPSPDMLLIDGNFKIEHALPQIPIIKGDQISVSIAAASIIAKVFRDQLMVEMDECYPGYDFAKHKGYGSRDHRLALQEKGMCPIHRKSFEWTAV
jgi:ribonuclease HII